MILPSLLSEITTRLTPISDTPALDASVLIAHIVKQPRTWVIAHPELTLTNEQQTQLDEALQHLGRGASFPYVLGHWDFFGMTFDVTPDVLIPRPETELLVEKAIAWLQRSPGRRSVADIGTGSGVIAVSIAANVPDVHILATDISHMALEVAQANARKFNVEDRIEFIECDLLPHLKPLFQWERGKGVREIDLLCANLPYIPTDRLHHLPIFGREPTRALDGGADGLDLIRRLISLATKWLTANGMMLLEIDSSHAKQALRLVQNAFPAADTKLHKDLAGQDRLLEVVVA